MKKKDLSELRNKDVGELKKKSEKLRLEIVKAKADLTASKEKNLKKVKNLRRDLAQILTLIREKQILEEVERESS